MLCIDGGLGELSLPVLIVYCAVQRLHGQIVERNRNAVPFTSPGLERFAPTLGAENGNSTNPERVGKKPSSIPKVILIKLHLVLPQQLSQFLLEGHLPVVFLLARNIFLHRFRMGGADREYPITGLPLKFAQHSAPAANPGAGSAFYLLDDLHHRVFSRQIDHRMHVVSRPVDDQRRRVPIFKNPGKIRLHLQAQMLIAQKGETLFGGKYKMN